MERGQTTNGGCDFRAVSVALVLCLTLSWPGVAEGQDSSDPQEVARATELESRIETLIGQLGSDSYVIRHRAQLELERLGVDAFESLQEAFHHPDPEVAAAARYLVNSARVEWSTESDSPEVKQVLKNYDIRPSGTRMALMEFLARLPNGQGWMALCRLAKFEPSTVLSKYAVMALLGRRTELDEKQRKQLAKSIRSVVRDGRRKQMIWLSSYADILEGKPVDTTKWAELVEEENRLLNSQSPETLDRIVVDFYRWNAVLFLESGHRDAGLTMARSGMRIVPNDSVALRDASVWSIDHAMPELVEELAGLYPAIYRDTADLAYVLAESFRKRNEEEKADKIATEAFAIRPLARDPKLERVYRAGRLQERTMFDWSIREYRRVIDENDPLDGWGLKARYYLSELLHDDAKDDEAHLLWKEILERSDADPAYRQKVQMQMELSDFIDPIAVIGQAYLYRAISASKAGDKKLAMKSLEKGFECDPDNADIIIAMYRFEGNDSWKRKVDDRIMHCSDYFRSQIRQTENTLNESGPNGVASSRRALATMNNQLAWLISNTKGDYQEALRCSLRSLELEPDTAGYLDTLGRCFYAVGDLDNAIQSQRRAVKLEPSGMAMKRQLKLFEEAKQAKEASK